MNCSLCESETEPKNVRLDYRWGEHLFVIEDVPAMVCTNCGEKYFRPRVVRELQKIARGEQPKETKTIPVPVVKFKEAV